MSFKHFVSDLNSIVLLDDDVKKVEEVVNSKREGTPLGKPCKYCPDIYFSDQDSFREHYQTDWHTFNQARCLKNMPAISEDEYEELMHVTQDDSESSDFWSEVDEEIVEESEDEANQEVSPIIQFTFQEEQYELYRRLLSRNRLSAISLSDLKAFISIAANSTWAIFLIKSGRVFAGIYSFKKESFILKKSFKRYTERRKQGGSQMLRDKSGKVANSAGSQIRRQNEVELLKDIGQLFVSWETELNGCQLVFWNKNFYSQLAMFQCPSILEKSDHRLRTYPFTSYKPSEEEATRCIKRLCPANLKYERKKEKHPKQ